MSRFAFGLLGMGLVASLGACHAGTCVPGETIACECAGGGKGQQTCVDVDTFGPCSCGAGIAASGTSTATTTTSSTSDAGPAPQCATSCAAVASDSCNALTQQGSCVTTTIAADNATFSGGTISPGTYRLEAMTFVSTPPTEFTFAMTVDVAQTGTDSYELQVLRSDTSCPESRLTYMGTASNGHFTTTETCPNAGNVVTSDFRVDDACHFTMHGGFGYLQVLEFAKVGGCTL